MGHGYIGDGYGLDGGPDRDRGRDDDRRDWRGEQRRDWSDRERGPFMFDRDDPRRDRARYRNSDRFEGRDDDRGFFSRTADDARDWFREDEHDYRPTSDARRTSSHPDDHYLRWRQQHMDALDRDYEDYCSERQQQFHQDFDSWRRNRQAGSSSGSQPSGQELEELELSDRDMTGTGNTVAGANPTSEATLGTNTPENSHTNLRGR